MPATNAWNELSPAGTDLASQIDDFMRAMKLDIRERMAIDHIWNVSQAEDGFHRGVTIHPLPNVTPITMPAGQSTFDGANTGGIMHVSQTWNTTGVMRAIMIDVVNTASAPTSQILAFYQGGTPAFTVAPNGNVFIGGTLNVVGVTNFTSNLRVAGVGSLANLHIARVGDEDTGLWWNNTDFISMVAGGVVSFTATRIGTAPHALIQESTFGTGDVGGALFSVGRNQSGGGAAGTLGLQAANGTFYFFWVDVAGKLRQHTNFPRVDGVASGDMSGTIIGGGGGGGTGTFLADNGSGAAPAYSFASNSQAGLYSVGPDDTRYTTHLNDVWGASLFAGTEIRFDVYAARIQGKGGTYGAGQGQTLILGQNQSLGKAVGVIGFTGPDNIVRYIWVSTDGKVRVGLNAPTANGSVPDASGTVVGTQT